MDLSACVACKRPVLELEGQFDKLDSFFLGDGGPPRESAGFWHLACLRAADVGSAWQAARLRNYRDVRRFTVVAERSGWVVLREPQGRRSLAIGATGELVDLSVVASAILRKVDGGVVFTRSEDCFHLELADLAAATQMQQFLERTSEYPLSAVLLALGIEDRVVDAVALEGAKFRFDESLRSFWQKGAVSARLDYGVFVPSVLLADPG